MSRVLVTGPPPGFVGSRVILQLLAAGRRPGARVSFIAADRDHGAERLDAVAGCEYVDDRIRLPE